MGQVDKINDLAAFLSQRRSDEFLSPSSPCQRQAIGVCAL
jgi:hypothetical protein